MSISTHNDLSFMIDEYNSDLDYENVMLPITWQKNEEPYSLQDGYLLYGNRICVTHLLREKVNYPMCGRNIFLLAYNEERDTTS